MMKRLYTGKTGAIIFILMLLASLPAPLLSAEPVKTDDKAYRDYLLSILYTIPDRTPGDDEFGPVLSDAQVQQLVHEYLDAKCKQNFKTGDTAQVELPLISSEILVRILKEDLHKPASSIPPRGSKSYYEYQEILIQLTGKTKQYLSSTYFFNFNRTGIEKTTRLAEVITTLQQFMRDGVFGPDVASGSIFKSTMYNPYFLYRDEWLEYIDTSFYPENLYSFKTGVFSSPADRQKAEQLVAGYIGGSQNTKFKDQLQAFLDLDTFLVEGHQYFFKEEYNLAEDRYRKAWNAVDIIIDAMSRAVKYTKDGQQGNRLWTPSLKSAAEFRTSLDPAIALNLGGPLTSMVNEAINIPAGIVPASWPFSANLFTFLANRYDTRKDMQVKNLAQLGTLESLNTVDKNMLNITKLNDMMVSLVPHIRFLLLPVSFGDLYTAMGDYSKAASYYALCFRENLLRASSDTKTPPSGNVSTLPDPDGDKPWNSVRKNDNFLLNGATYPYINDGCELPFIKMHIANLYLMWADSMYKKNTEAEIFRARELYKTVIKLYGRVPDIFSELKPVIVKSNTDAAATQNNTVALSKDKNTKDTIPELNWKDYSSDKDVYWMDEDSAVADKDIQFKDSAIKIPSFIITDPLVHGGMVPYYPLPAIKSNSLIEAQIRKAQMAIAQTDLGLNFYGFSAGSVPSLRYEVLIQAAKNFASLAKQAEDDYISFLEKSENAEIDVMEAKYALEKAMKRIQVEKERILKVSEEMKIAGIQVQQVKDAITAKEKEIADADSFWGQVKSYFKGMAGFFKAIPGGATKAIGKDYAAAFSGGGSIGGAAGAGGFALFGIASYVSIDGMVSERNKLQSQLKTLTTQQLPMAEAAQKAKEHELAITQIESDIALLEADFTRELYSYLSLRTLNTDTWNWLAVAVKGVMERYINLAAMTGWLAQSALNYEQNRSIDLIRFDYFDPVKRGLLSAERLQSDLALLDNEYLSGYQVKLPVKWQVSLARDFPLAFGELISTGTCHFMTVTDPLTAAFPGSHSHRIRTVEITVVAPVAEAVFRGILTNDGISYIKSPAGEKVIVRPPDALPVSAFTWQSDMALYGFPEKTLFPFEGSGFESYWTLQFPQEANPGGMSMLADVIITFDMYTQVNSGLGTETIAKTYTDNSRLSLISLKQVDPDVFDDFITSQSDFILFPVTEDYFPRTKGTRKIENVFILFTGKDLPVIKGRLLNDNIASPVNFTTENGLAFSNNISPADPAAAGLVPSALNVFAGKDPETDWTLQVSAGTNSTLNRKSVTDIIFGIEYSETNP